MKKIFSISLSIFIFVLISIPAFSEDGLPTLEFARQTGELIGQAKMCGVDTLDVNQRLIEGIAVLATYRKESPETAIRVYKNSIQEQLNSASFNADCTQVKSDFAQVEAKLKSKVKE